MNQAWECPRCKRINAPFNFMCFCSPALIPSCSINTKSIKTDENTLNINIEDFEFRNYFTTRTIKCLRAEGVRTLDQLLGWCEHQLIKTPNLGEKTLSKIKDVLKLGGLYLGDKNSYKAENGYSKCQSCIINQETPCK
jgi:DNA-directed RNA polymerase alpha subunit